MRVLIGVLFSNQMFIEALGANAPSLAYYALYGLLHSVVWKYHRKDDYFAALYLLSIIDIISNAIEALIRNNISLTMLKAVILVGLFRSIIAYLIYINYKNRELYVMNLEHQKRYAQLNLLVSNIQSELFYLNKSKADIENVMGKSYTLYENLETQPVLARDALSISKDVHEIKKDYSRVLAGFNEFITTFESNDSMKISDVFKIIKDNTSKLIATSKKDISFSITHVDDEYLTNYYSLFTILNNLIINSLEASEKKTIVRVSQYSDEHFLYFKVYDTATGISEDVKDYIFNPGFTTKFDMETGKQSTGIGLAHIMNILNELGGTIDLATHENQYTQFKISIPKNKLLRRLYE